MNFGGSMPKSIIKPKIRMLAKNEQKKTLELCFWDEGMFGQPQK